MNYDHKFVALKNKITWHRIILRDGFLRRISRCGTARYDFFYRCYTTMCGKYLIQSDSITKTIVANNRCLTCEASNKRRKKSK